jgi:hypothetical protein
MVISFIEAADMSFKAALSVAVTIGGMMAATAMLKTEDSQTTRLDLSRPVLWPAEPTRVPAPFRFATDDAVNVSADAGPVCVSTIGLRIDCDLIGASAL